MSSAMGDGYPAPVWQRFRSPAHAGAPGAGAAIGRGGARKQGGELELWLEVEAGKVARAGFRAFGCPYLVASAEAACESCAGQPAAALLEFDAGALLQQLQVPPERFPVKIWVEDAVRAAARAAVPG